MVTKSSPENASVLDVTCDLGLQQKPTNLVADDFSTDPEGKSIYLLLIKNEYESVS